MHPLRRLGGELERDRPADDDRANDQDEESRRPVADVEGVKVEPACAAFVREG